MMTALYRRYRPDTFEDVIGQEHVTKALQASLANGRINHAYLFSGPRGCGKTTSARILARCLNCVEGPTPTPCGKCDSCRDLATGGPGSLDVVEIDSASHNGVDDARELRERATFAPARDRFKIFILDEAHMVTPQGFNALLKLVEEPPPHIKFIFATTDPDKVIGTIRSRTHHYPFRLVAPEVLREYLAELCEKEGVKVEDGVLGLAVRAGGGSVRDSLSILDQLIAGETEPILHYERAVALLGYTDSSLLSGLVDGLIAESGAEAYGVVDRMIQTGHDPRRFAEDLLQYLRNLMILRLAGAGADAVLGDVPAAELEKMRIQVSARPPRTWTRAAELVNEGLTDMGGASSPRLSLELLVAKLLLEFGARAETNAGEGRRDNSEAAKERESVSTEAPIAALAPPQNGEDPAPAGARSAEQELEEDRHLKPVSAIKPETKTETKAEEEETAWKFEPTPWGIPGESVEPAEMASAQRSAASGSASVKSQEGDYETIRARWKEIMDAMQDNHFATIRLLAEHGQLRGLRDGVVEIAFKQNMVRAFTDRHSSALVAAIQRVTGLNLGVRGVVGGFGAPQAIERGEDDSGSAKTQPGGDDFGSGKARSAEQNETVSPSRPEDGSFKPSSPASPPAAEAVPDRPAVDDDTPGIGMAQAILGGTIIDSGIPGTRGGTGANR